MTIDMGDSVCQTCADWTGRYCQQEGSPYYCRLTGAGWGCRMHSAAGENVGFADFLKRRCPRKGPLRGLRHKLALALGYPDMQIHHWVKGQCRPGPDLVPKIAVFFNLPDAAVERMILADVRSRAEQVWRAGNSEARRMKKAPV